MDSSPDTRDQAYWKANLRAVSVLLVVWFIVGYVLSIFLVEPLNKIRVAGFPLGFWFAQQGSIYVFIVLILVYACWMDKVDKAHDVHEGGDS